MSCQQTFVSPVEVVGLSKLHLLHQSCGRRANHSFTESVYAAKAFPDICTCSGPCSGSAT